MDAANVLARERRLSLGKILGVQPQRGALLNLDNQREVQFLFNPTQLNETHEAVYTRKTAPGLSHERMMFSHNKNLVIPLDLVYDELVFNERQRGKRPVQFVAARNNVDYVRRELMAMVYPRRSQKLITASPPQVLFSWPGLFSMRVRVTKARFRHVFFQNGIPLPRIIRMTVTIEEDVAERMFSDQMQRFGTMRPWATSNRARRRGT